MVAPFVVRTHCAGCSNLLCSWLDTQAFPSTFPFDHVWQGRSRPLTPRAGGARACRVCKIQSLPKTSCFNFGRDVNKNELTVLMSGTS